MNFYLSVHTRSYIPPLTPGSAFFYRSVSQRLRTTVELGVSAENLKCDFKMRLWKHFSAHHEWILSNHKSDYSTCKQPDSQTVAVTVD